MVSLEAIEAIDDIEVLALHTCHCSFFEQIRLLVKELLERVRLQDLEIQEKDTLLDQKGQRIRELEHTCEELMMQLEKHSGLILRKQQTFIEEKVDAITPRSEKSVQKPSSVQTYQEIPQEDCVEYCTESEESDAKHTEIAIMHVDPDDISELSEVTIFQS